jgi:hypothetical protein
MSDTEQQSKPTLRPAQVAASTLAAVTGAFLAARIGVYGTVIGVGVISLLSTIGSDFYLRSLDRTKRAALARARYRNASVMSFSGHESEDTTDVAFGAAAPVADAGTVHEYRVAAATEDTPAEPADTEEWTAETRALPADTEEIAADAGALPADTEEIAAGSAAFSPDDTAPLPLRAPLVAGGDPTTIEPPAEAEGPRRRIRWPMIAAGTVAAFALAMLVITGIEALTGSRLSGGEGSTIGTVFTPDRAEQPVDEVPEPDPALTPTPPVPGQAPAPDQPPTEGPAPVDPPAEDDPAEEPGPPADEPTPGDPGDEGGS